VKRFIRELVAGAWASAFLVGLAVVTNLSCLPLLGLSAAVYAGVRMALPGPPPIGRGAAGKKDWSRPPGRPEKRWPRRRRRARE